jgi:hypothetical protein
VLVRRNWREHLPWIAFILAVTALSIYWYTILIADRSWERRPTGSSMALFLFGIAGGLICLFEFLLWPRKHMRFWLIGPTKVWMRAHIWLGLLAVPLLILHSGFYFRNTEATLLLLLFFIVILSGVWGLIMQQVIPGRLLREVPAETIYSQIPHVSNLLLEEADRLVIQTCGVSDAEEHAPGVGLVAARDEEAMLANAAAGAHYTLGAIRTVGGMSGKVLQSQAARAPIPNSEPIREFFNKQAAIYLKVGAGAGSPLADSNQARILFGELRLSVPPAAHESVNSLENLCDQRRQFDHQARLHYWLHNWLWVHLPLSLALIVLMFVHVFRTLQYWWPS